MTLDKVANNAALDQRLREEYAKVTAAAAAEFVGMQWLKVHNVPVDYGEVIRYGSGEWGFLYDDPQVSAERMLELHNALSAFPWPYTIGEDDEEDDDDGE
jgi:hypothetical protein